MRIDFNIQWVIDDLEHKLDNRLLELLEKINQQDSLQAAATELNISYRTAWEMIRSANQTFQKPICTLQRGRGTELSDLGQTLLKTKHLIESEYLPELRQKADSLNREIDKLIGDNKKTSRLSCYASHDLAINFFKELCEDITSINIEFHSQGSLDNLRLLNTNEADIVGFHFPDDPALKKNLSAEYAQWLDDERHTLIQLAIREQGLMFKPTLTKRITSLKSLTRRSLRFVNRQKGSGTRTIFDELLNINNINEDDINGYNDEEFTHSAVAAMISSDHADVGFGIKASAIEFDLSFLPLLTESYVIAFNNTLPVTSVGNIRKALKDSRLKPEIDALPGYNSNKTGKRIHVKKLLS